MIVTILRKPLGGTVLSTMLQHGTGSLNIDGTRIALTSECKLDHVQRQQNSGGSVEGAFGAASLIGKEIQTYKAGGRWAANLLLQHLPGCQSTGKKTVPGYVINQWKDGAKPFGGGAGHPYQTTQVATDEQVDLWQCVEGCPVTGLDRQSGVSKSSGGGLKHAGGNQIYGKYDSIQYPPQVGLGDTGGASRYFKIFTSEDPKQ